MLDSLPVKHLFSYSAVVDPHYLGNSNGGMDLMLNIVSGTFTGQRNEQAFNGKLLADFCSDVGVLRGCGAIRSEVHLLLETDDGEQIHMNYHANTVPQPDGSFRAFNFPFFETSSEKYGWINTVQAITVYNFDETGGVVCDVYELAQNQ